MNVDLKANHILDASTLCQACGLCCQGQLYSWVPLLAEEVELAKTWPVEMVTHKDAAGFKQPCACFQDHRCSVYSQRPQTCAKYKCRLLQRLEQNEISRPEALKLAAQALELFEKIQIRLPLTAGKRIWERITERWDLSTLQPLLASGELDADTLVAIIALDALLTRYFRHASDRQWFNISEV